MSGGILSLKTQILVKKALFVAVSSFTSAENLVRRMS